MNSTQHTHCLEGLSREAAVGYWDALLRSQRCTEEDYAAFRLWKESDPENEIAFDRAQMLIRELDHISKHPQIRSMREAALSSDVRRAKSLGRRFSFAALIMVAFALGVLLLNVQLIPSGRSAGQFASNEVSQLLYSTAVGERSTIPLVDGTIATLNTDTQMRVEYSTGERLVTLIKGEAFFDVAQNPNRPFCVAAGNQRIKALGTAFDVRYLNDELRVSLLEGRVEVAGNNGAAPALERAGLQHVAPPSTQLIPGQQLISKVSNENEIHTVRKTDIDKIAIWRQNRIFFEDETLPDAVAEMNRYSSAKIYIEGNDLSKLRLNGTFTTGQQAAFANALEAYFPIKVERKNEEHYVIRSASAG